MKKGNVVEFSYYLEQKKEREALKKPTSMVSKELQKAIKTLIQQLRRHKTM